MKIVRRNENGQFAKKKVDYEQVVKLDIVKGQDGNMYLQIRKLKQKTQFFIIGRNRQGDMTEVEVNWTPRKIT